MVLCSREEVPGSVTVNVATTEEEGEDDQFQGEAFGEFLKKLDAKFSIGGLIGLVHLKAQGNPGFPFETNPGTMMVCVIDLLVYALASAAEEVFTAPTRTRSRSGAYLEFAKATCSGILVGALASLFF